MSEIADGGMHHVVEVGVRRHSIRLSRQCYVGEEVALVGVLTGYAGQINTAAILTKAISLRGVYVVSIADLEAALAFGVPPIIDRTFAFDQADEAFAHLHSGVHIGKIAITIGCARCVDRFWKNRLRPYCIAGNRKRVSVDTTS